MPIYECKYYALVSKRYAAPSAAEAVRWTRQFLSPGDLLWGVVQIDPPLPPDDPEPTPVHSGKPPRGSPSGGTPGTPVIKVPVLADAIAA